MLLWLEEAFVLRAGARLTRFRRTAPSVWTFRCPLCGDSAKSKTKTRAYFYKTGDHYSFKCFNCTEAMTLRRYLTTQAPDLAEEFRRERQAHLLGSANRRSLVMNTEKSRTVDVHTAVNRPQIVNIPGFSWLADLPEIHPARMYAGLRCLPKSRWDSLGYCTNWKQFVQGLGWPSEGADGTERGYLVLLAKDASGAILAAQGRLLDPHPVLRYLKAVAPGQNGVLFGADRLDVTRPVWVVEGPIDSLCLDNAVAVMHSGLHTVPDTKWIRLYDNEPHNKQILKGMRQTIDLGAPIVIWPPRYRDVKDVNDLVQRIGWSPADASTFFSHHVYAGVKARVKFLEWQR